MDFSSAIVRVDGYQAGTPTVVSSEAGKYTYQVSVSAVGNATAVGAHSVTLVGAKDLLANEAATLTSSYTVSSDTTAPTVKSISAVSKNSFKVTFTESVQAAPSIKVMKGAVQYTATLVQELSTLIVWILILMLLL